MMGNEEATVRGEENEESTTRAGKFSSHIPTMADDQKLPAGMRSNNHLLRQPRSWRQHKPSALVWTGTRLSHNAAGN